MNLIITLEIVAFFFIMPVCGSALFPAGESTLIKPPTGTLYHGVFAPEEWASAEDQVTEKSIRSYENVVGKSVVWAVISDIWSNEQEFPHKQAQLIRNMGSVPYIRLMITSVSQNEQEPVYTLENINDGLFDDSIRSWVRDAATFGSPIIIEFGSEVDGPWFPWNGYWYGSLPSPELFKEVYKRIIDIADEEGSDNIIWVYHINAVSIPDESWDQFVSYYPGDEYIDWIGVSVYGAKTPMDDEVFSFSDTMDNAYQKLISISPNKPIIIAEFGTTNTNLINDQALWAEDAFVNLTEHRWPKVIGFSWWNEQWKNDDDERHNTNMRVEDNPALAEVFQRYVGSNDFVLGNPEIRGENVANKMTLDYSPDIIIASESDL